jgi:hypothetical protein
LGGTPTTVIARVDLRTSRSRGSSGEARALAPISTPAPLAPMTLNFQAYGGGGAAHRAHVLAPRRARGPFGKTAGREDRRGARLWPRFNSFNSLGAFFCHSLRILAAGRFRSRLRRGQRSSPACSPIGTHRLPMWSARPSTCSARPDGLARFAFGWRRSGSLRHWAMAQSIWIVLAGARFAAKLPLMRVGFVWISLDSLV